MAKPTKKGTVLGMAGHMQGKAVQLVRSAPARIPVRYGMERKRQRKPGARRSWESRRGTATFVGNWDDADAHKALRQLLQAQHPGWQLQGYAIVR